MADAVFIPPAPHYVNPLMSDLEKFLHNKDIHVPALITVGLAHYQFETIHPFLDGNGRIEVCQLSTKAANDLVSNFEENKWLKKMGHSERYRRFILNRI